MRLFGEHFIIAQVLTMPCEERGLRLYVILRPLRIYSVAD